MTLEEDRTKSGQFPQFSGYFGDDFTVSAFFFPDSIARPRLSTSNSSFDEERGDFGFNVGSGQCQCQ